jgi:hypothetical protein
MVGDFESKAAPPPGARILCSIHMCELAFAPLRGSRAAALLLGVAAILLHPAASLAAVVTSGPYVQMGTSTGMTIRWRTDRPDPGRVLYGSAVGALNGTADQGAAITDHAVALTGLEPGHRYYYAIADAAGVIAGGDASCWFTTAPAPGARGPERIWVIGDSGTADAGAAAVRDAFAAYTGNRTPDVWLMLGDNAYDKGTDAEYQKAVFAMYPQMLRNVVLWPARGNHDASLPVFAGDFTLPANGEAGGVRSGTESYYSFDYGEIHFICLDSQGSSRLPTGPMANWLRADLAADGSEWTISPSSSRPRRPRRARTHRHRPRPPRRWRCRPPPVPSGAACSSATRCPVPGGRDCRSTRSTAAGSRGSSTRSSPRARSRSSGTVATRKAGESAPTCTSSASSGVATRGRPSW